MSMSRVDRSTSSTIRRQYHIIVCTCFLERRSRGVPARPTDACNEWGEPYPFVPIEFAGAGIDSPRPVWRSSRGRFVLGWCLRGDRGLVDVVGALSRDAQCEPNDVESRGGRNGAVLSALPCPGRKWVEGSCDGRVIGRMYPVLVVKLAGSLGAVRWLVRIASFIISRVLNGDGAASLIRAGSAKLGCARGAHD